MIKENKKKVLLILQANIGSLFGLIALILSYLFHADQFINFRIIIILTVVSFYIYRVLFEYQRITLTLARCVKVKISNEENIGVVDIQVLLSSSILGFILFLEAIVFGIIAGYLLRISIVYLAIVLFVKYIVLAWIPIPTPFGVFFRLIDKELISAGRKIMISGHMKTMLFLISIYKEMPHDKSYEDWAFKEYGNALLAQK